MSNVPTETVCEECGNNGNDSDYCPRCGAEDPWEERAMYDWERDVDLPIVFSEEKYDDGYGLWWSFCDQVFGQYEMKESQIANTPDGLPSMKYSVIDVYYKLTKDLELKGPFLDEKEAREA